MRAHGTLVRWNDDRGFGFVSPSNGKSDIFVHISAFPRDGVRPRQGELISFEVESGPDGKQRAVRIMRPAQAAAQRPVATRRPVAGRNERPARSAGVGRAIAFLIIAGIGAYGYSQYRSHAAATAPTGADAPMRLESRPSPYSCDGRTMCSQMRSCGEAEYFLRNCPNTQMDGDGDGVPCESQWCE